MVKKIKKNLFLIIGSIFVFGLFFYISYRTPLAGDDWGYYLNSLNQSPFVGAIDFYNSWSGRFFSEMWGFFMPAHKMIWNIVNPLLFTGIFICIYLISKPSKNKILTVLFILAIMLSVDDNLRMETYTWIMGTTYIVPLFLSLLYFLSVKKLINDEMVNKTILYLNNICLLIIGLMMENIAVTMIGAIVILIIYCFIKNKRHTIKYLIINLVFSVLSFSIMRLSPGSTYRLLRDNTEWMKLSVFEKIENQYPNFIQLTFINNDYMIALLSIVFIGCIISSKSNKIIKIKCTIVNVIAVLTEFSFIFIKENNIFVDGNSLYSKIFWPIYIINIFVGIIYSIDNKTTKEWMLFILVIAGASSLAMLFSPTFGSRSVVYTVYYIILLTCLLLKEINIKYSRIVFTIICILIIGDRTYEYVYKYTLVGKAQEERLEIIKYYQEHPEDEEVWIPRFPIYTVHGADIEIGDDYHFETFKEYYKLPQDKNKIVFYVKDN